MVWLPDPPSYQSAKNSPAASALTWGGSVTSAAVESACLADQVPPGDMEFASITEVGPEEVAQTTIAAPAEFITTSGASAPPGEMWRPCSQDPFAGR